MTPASNPTSERTDRLPSSLPDPMGVRVHWVGALAEHRHPADVYAQIVAGSPPVTIVDARWPEVFAREHLPGAISLPVRQIDEASTARLRRDVEIVVYCWNTSCHASTKAAHRLEALGFLVKELYGGLEAWRKQGFPTERG